MDFLNVPGFVFLDGAMGTMLRAAVPGHEGLPDLLSLTAPDAVTAVHRAYVEAGSRLLCTNTFGATDEKLSGTPYTLEQVITASVAAARRAAGGRAAVALDIGPTGRLAAPAGDLTFDAAYESYRRRVVCGAEAGADLIFFETMSDLSELRAAILAAKENTNLPIFASMTFGESGRTFTGCTPEAFAALVGAMGADALGINCSLGPEQIFPLIARIAAVTELPLIVKANAGLPSVEDGSYEITPERFAAQMRRMAEVGVKYLGGCCGTTPDTIRALARAYEGVPLRTRTNAPVCLLGGGQKTVDAEKITVVGERLNPTGKKKLAAALAQGDMDAVAALAREQAAAGADVLDINVGVPGADETSLMRRVVETVVSVTDLPLQIDSKNPAALEAGLRAYPGRAIINSVDGEATHLDTILPLAKKYGAAVIGLTLDEAGIPPTAEGRLAIARRIATAADRHGIPRSDLFIDCLTLSVSADPNGARETLRALSLIRDELRLKTALGVSNVSFGLPEREIISSAFLTLALQNGLTLPIINPCSRRMTDAVFAFRALSGDDPSCMEYVAYASGAPAGSSDRPVAGKLSLTDAILAGDDSAARDAADAALERGVSSAQLLSDELIPALDRVGERFESGEFFLPQLMRAAAAADAAVAAVRSRAGAAAPTRGEKILLATVRGDIHDIGKNIVKMVLQNYGYEILDLGRDVPPEEIVRRAAGENIRLVGLSALMTTTLPAMEETIRALRKSGHRCTVMVGGAVLTPEYAARIGADYYAKDAKQSADIAKIVFGGSK